MPHDEFNGGLVDVEIFSAVDKVRSTAERLIDGGHLKCRKIKNIFVSCGEFVRDGAQG